MTVPTPESAASTASSKIANCRFDSFLSNCLMSRLGLKEGPLLPGGLRGEGEDPFSPDGSVAASSGASFEDLAVTCRGTAPQHVRLSKAVDDTKVVGNVTATNVAHASTSRPRYIHHSLLITSDQPARARTRAKVVCGRASSTQRLADACHQHWLGALQQCPITASTSCKIVPSESRGNCELARSEPVGTLTSSVNYVLPCAAPDRVSFTT